MFPVAFGNILFFVPSFYRVHINCRSNLQNIFSQILKRNTWCCYHLKEECLQFHSDIKCSPFAQHARCTTTKPLHRANSTTHSTTLCRWSSNFSNIDLRFSRQMAIATIGPFQMLDQCVLSTWILRCFDISYSSYGVIYTHNLYSKALIVFG
jgi:hypothetical protein